MCSQPVATAKDKNIKHSISRPWYFDMICFLAPLLCYKLTDIFPVYFTGILRIVSIHTLLSLHYVFVDKDNYDMKISQRQLEREKKDYLLANILHMWAQVALQILFPGMFFTSNAAIPSCAWNTFLSHIFLVEPIYYIVHRWLHIPKNMKSMHSFHHMSVHTLPSTALVQDFMEHFVYIATFGPAMFVPYFGPLLLSRQFGANHWMVISAYLVIFDLVNAYGHTNIRVRHWVFESKWSPLRYLFYTPEFHLGHHAYYNYNYGLFMPIYDHLFGTYKEYKKSDVPQKPSTKQDFVFIGTYTYVHIYTHYSCIVLYRIIKYTLYMLYTI